MATNNQLRYTSRDYGSIKEDLVGAINSVTSNWTSREDSDPGMILTNLMAYLGDNLSFNLDMQALEMYLPTVTQRKNIKKLLSLVGYKMHWYRSAICDVTITNNQTEDIILNLDITSNECTNRLVSFVSDTNYVILPPESNANNIVINGNGSQTFTAVEGTVAYATINADDISDNKFYIPNNNVDEAHLFLYTVVDDNTLLPWTLVDDIVLQSDSAKSAYSSDDDKVGYFEFDTDEYDRPFIKLVSYWKDILRQDSNSYGLRLYYIMSNGANGNVTDNAFYSLESTPKLATSGGYASDFTISNVNNWNTLYGNNCPGYNPQTTNEARNDSKNYINTYNTLVTISDFEKFILQNDGFNASLAIDIQRAKDLNTQIYKDTDVSTNSSSSDIDAIRMCRYVCKEGYLPLSNTNNSSYPYEADVPSYSYMTFEAYNNLHPDATIQDITGVDLTQEEGLEKYTLNIYTIYDNYNVDYNGINNIEEWNSPSNPKNLSDNNTQEDNVYPYRRYKPSSTVINGADDNNLGGIMTKLKNAKIMNVEVNFATCRVFDWRATGTIYLNKPVMQEEADNIIKNICNALAIKFTPDYVKFGEKISYMDVIDTIQNADSRIRYFDAGRGKHKLVDWSDCFDVDNYFNPISIMRYNQYSVPINREDTLTYSEQFNVDEEGNQLLVVDSSCIIDN